MRPPNLLTCSELSRRELAEGKSFWILEIMVREQVHSLVCSL